jgi:hypothetical protein
VDLKIKMGVNVPEQVCCVVMSFFFLGGGGGINMALVFMLNLGSPKKLAKDINV